MSVFVPKINVIPSIFYVIIFILHSTTVIEAAVDGLHFDNVVNSQNTASASAGSESNSVFSVPLTTTVGPSTSSIQPLITTDEPLPYDQCICKTYSCECCGTLELDAIGIDDTFCVDVGYDPVNYGVSLVLSVDRCTILNITVSATNPPPICTAIPVIRDIATICIRFEDVHIWNKTFHSCVHLQVRIFLIFMVADLNLGCFDLNTLSSKHMQHYQKLLTGASNSTDESLIRNESDLPPELAQKVKELKKNATQNSKALKNYFLSCSSEGPMHNHFQVLLIAAVLSSVLWKNFFTQTVPACF